MEDHWKQEQQRQLEDAVTAKPKAAIILTTCTALVIAGLCAGALALWLLLTPDSEEDAIKESTHAFATSVRQDSCPGLKATVGPGFPHSCSELQKPLIAPPRSRMPEDGRVACIDVRCRIARVQYEYGDAEDMGFTPELTGSIKLEKQADGSRNVTNLASPFTPTN